MDSGRAADVPDIDFDGNTRPQGSGYDIGAYEYTGGIQPSPTPEPKPDAVVIDDTDGGFSTSFSQDAWQECTEAGGQHYGDSHHYDSLTDAGRDKATWSFTVPKPGRYEVYAWWWEGSYRPTDVPYKVNNLDGSTIVRLNQQRDGGQWNLLGSFPFQDEGSVVVSDDVSSGRDVVADAVRLVYLWPIPPRNAYRYFFPIAGR